MNINLDKFWEFLRYWSVGKIIVTLSLLIILFKDFENGEYPINLNYLIAIGVFHELFDLSHNRVTDPVKPIKKPQAIIFNVFMGISILSIIGVILKLLWK